jgi:hypothetical protein
VFKLFGNDDNNDNQCSASGWTVRPASTRPTGGTDQRCPAGDHKVTTTPVRGGAVRIGNHRR